jgi:hypothetical protein
VDLIYFDCPSGAAGDMILAALIDAGLPIEHMEAELARLDLTGYRLKTFTERKHALSASRFVVEYEPQHHHRRFSDIRAMIEKSGLNPETQEAAIRIFRRLAEAEARVHGVDMETVHFHEVGAVDSIVDVVGAAAAWVYFGRPKVYASPLPLGSGFIQTAHGRLPLPAPATLALLEGVPTYGAGVEAELVTPTGAAVLSTLADSFGPRPPMIPGRTGYGAGGRNLEDRPNVLRATLGTSTSAVPDGHLVVAQTNIDDMNPEIAPYIMEKLLEAGARDVWTQPVQMKKGRTGLMLSFLADSKRAADLADLVLAESTTLGVRWFPVQRRTLPRESVTLDTPFGPAEFKKTTRDGRRELTPEFETCRRIANQTSQPLQHVYRRLSALGEQETENE